jgi:predicted GNAT family acetyltransferase
MADPVLVTDNVSRRRFEVELAGEVAFAEYALEPGRIILPHTVVPPAFEGKGVGGALARYAFGYAQDKGLAVVPTCPFMAAWVKKHPGAQDLLDPDCLAELGLA